MGRNQESKAGFNLVGSVGIFDASDTILLNGRLHIPKNKAK
jgi:hypothetical protein